MGVSGSCGSIWHKLRCQEIEDSLERAGHENVDQQLVERVGDGVAIAVEPSTTQLERIGRLGDGRQGALVREDERVRELWSGDADDELADALSTLLSEDDSPWHRYPWTSAVAP